MDKPQLKSLAERAESARRIREIYGSDFNKIETLQIYSSQIPLLAQQIVESLPKFDLSNFAKSVQLTFPKINYSQIIPKIDYSQFIKDFYIQLPKIDPSLITEIYGSQVLGFQEIALNFAKIHAPDLAKIRANALLMTSSFESVKNITELSN